MAVRLGNILQRFQARLAADETLAAWCADNLGRAALIQVGNEPTDDPQQWQLPAIVMVPDRRDAGETVREHRAAVLVECRLQVEQLDASGGADRPVRVYQGVYTLDAFAEQVAGALSRSLDGTAASLDVTGEVLETQEFYPIMVADLRVTLTTPVVIGGEINLE